MSRLERPPSYIRILRANLLFSASSNKTNSLEATPESTEKKIPPKKENSAPVLPPVSHEVMRTLSDRHSKGLMSPYIYQILSQVRIVSSC